MTKSLACTVSLARVRATATENDRLVAHQGRLRIRDVHPAFGASAMWSHPPLPAELKRQYEHQGTVLIMCAPPETLRHLSPRRVKPSGQKMLRARLEAWLPRLIKRFPIRCLT